MNEEQRCRTARTATTARASPTRIAVAAALVVLAGALPMPASARCQIQTIDLPVKMVGSRAIATVGINGTPVPLTVDSGAFYSVLTDAAAAQLGLPLKKNPTLRVEGITGRVETRTTMVDKLQLLEGVIDRVEFVVGVNEPGAGTMGLMGRNILSFSDTEYDLAHGVIRFHFPNDDCGKTGMAYWAGSAPVVEIDLIESYRSKVPAIRAQAKLNGQTVVALFDTGATTVVSARTARRVGVADADLKPAGTVYGAGQGRAQAWTAPFEKFELGGEAISNNRLPVADFSIDDGDMLLGIDFFLSHRIYVSKKQSKMFFTYNGGPVFALDRTATVPAGDVARARGPAADEALTADQFARRGAASVARRDYDGALADFDRACELAPTTAAFFAQRGAVQATLRRPAQALQDFDRALTLDPSDADARYRRAQVRTGAHDVAGATADLDALDDALPPQSQARLGMAALFIDLRQPARALAELNQWLPAHPHEVTRDGALNARCWARVLLGVELDRALDDCDEAVDSDPKNAAYLDSRGWVYLRQAKLEKALADFERSIAVRPNAAALYGRGLARTRLGDAAQGDADLAAARRLQPDIDGRVPRTGLVAESTPKP